MLSATLQFGTSFEHFLLLLNTMFIHFLTLIVVAGPRAGPHLLPGRRTEGEGAAADAADVQRPDRVRHRPHAAQDGAARHIRRLLAASRCVR